LINDISNYYAKKSAVTVASESSESILAQFISLNNAQDFFQLENALKALNSVASLDILKIQNHEVTFRIHLLSTQDEFETEVERLRSVAKVEASYIEPEQTPEFEVQDNTLSVGGVEPQPEAEEAPQVVTPSNLSAEVKASDAESETNATDEDEAAVEVAGSEVVETTGAPKPLKPSLVYEWIR
jgi:hypothetical protein